MTDIAPRVGESSAARRPLTTPTVTPLERLRRLRPAPADLAVSLALKSLECATSDGGLGPFEPLRALPELHADGDLDSTSSKATTYAVAAGLRWLIATPLEPPIEAIVSLATDPVIEHRPGPDTLAAELVRAQRRIGRAPAATIDLRDSPAPSDAPPRPSTAPTPNTPPARSTVPTQRTRPAAPTPPPVQTVRSRPRSRPATEPPPVTGIPSDPGRTYVAPDVDPFVRSTASRKVLGLLMLLAGALVLLGSLVGWVIS